MSRSFVSRAFGTSQELIQIVTPTGDFIYVNNAWKSTLGYSSEELLELSLFDLLDDLGKAKYDDLFRKGKHAEPLERVEIGLRSRDGLQIALEGSITCRFRNGKIVCAHGFFQDVSGRRREEEAANNSEPPYRLLVENAIDIISMLDNDGLITSLNPAFERITGWGRDYWLGKTLTPLLHPDDTAYSNEMFQRALHGRRVPLYQSRVLTKSAGYVTVETTLRAMHEGTELKGVLGIHRDITERKKVEEALRESEARFRRLAEASFDGIAIHDNGRIVECNQRFAELYGYEVSKIIGKTVMDLTAVECRDNVMKVISSLEEIDYIKTGLRRDGSRLTVEVRSKPIPYQGRMARVAAIRDLTALGASVEGTALTEAQGGL